MFQNIASLSDRIELSNGTSMPAFGLGVFLVSNDEAPATVRAAVSAGYCLIDTAAVYRNLKVVQNRHDTQVKMTF